MDVITANIYVLKIARFVICKKCDFGFDLIKVDNFCKGACDDGLTKNEEECDDENKRDGDGCSLFCKVEQNYVCKNFQFSFSQCIYSKQPEFLMKFVEERNQIQYVSLYFSQQVKTINKIIDTQSIDLVVIDMDPSFYSLNLVVIQETSDDVQNVEYLVEISFFQTMDLIPKLQDTLKNPLYNINNAQLLNYIGKNGKNIFLFLDDQKQKEAETLKNLNQQMSNSMGGIGFATILIGNSLFLGSILEELQQQSYLRFINVVFPFNLYNYFESSNIISIQPLLDYVKFEKLMHYFDTEQIYVESYQKLQQYEINADIFTNIQGQILQIILIGISYVACIIINRVILSLKILKYDSAYKLFITVLNYIVRVLRKFKSKFCFQQKYTLIFKILDSCVLKSYLFIKKQAEMNIKGLFYLESSQNSLYARR